MEILKISSRYRRDFRANMICKYCGHIERNVNGYDDDYFHQNVIPNMVCVKCGKKAGKDYKPMKPIYEENEII